MTARPWPSVFEGGKGLWWARAAAALKRMRVKGCFMEVKKFSMLESLTIWQIAQIDVTRDEALYTKLQS